MMARAFTMFACCLTLNLSSPVVLCQVPDVPTYDLRLDTPLMFIPDVLTRELGVSVSLERPLSRFVWGREQIRAEFHLATVESILDEVCAQSGAQYTWLRSHSGSPSAYVIYPSAEHNLPLGVTVDCTGFRQITIPELIQSVHGCERVRLVTEQDPHPLAFTRGRLSEEPWLQQRIDLSDLGSPSLREAMCVAMARTGFQDLLYITDWTSQSEVITAYIQENGYGGEGQQLVDLIAAEGQILITLHRALPRPAVVTYEPEQSLGGLDQ